MQIPDDALELKIKHGGKDALHSQTLVRRIYLHVYMAEISEQGVKPDTQLRKKRGDYLSIQLWVSNLHDTLTKRGQEDMKTTLGVKVRECPKTSILV